MRGIETTCCLLPGGYTDDRGVRHREIELRGLTGLEEELLASRQPRPPAELVTEIISRCLVRLGSVGGVTLDTARRLLVADRQYILLRLREISFGDRVRTTVTCPVPQCGSRIDVDFSLHDIPVRELEREGPTYPIELSSRAALETETGELLREIWFRLPDGGDQEAVSQLIDSNEARALTLLLERCIRRMGPISDPDGELVSQLSPLARFEIEKAMEAVAPRLDLAMAVACPECSHGFELPFNLQEMFFGEFRTGLDLLYREVHCLAYHYHWSEREILEMSGRKRGRYIEILADELERMNHGA